MNKTVFMPEKGKNALLSDSPRAVILPTDFLDKTEEWVSVDGLQTNALFNVSEPLDLHDSIIPTIAKICGFESETEALAFLQSSFERPELTWNNLTAYCIVV